jgi:hypothetical protein
VPDANQHLRLQFIALTAKSSFRSQSAGIKPVLKRMRAEPSAAVPDRPFYRYELDFDFSRVSADTTVDVTVENMSWNDPEGRSGGFRALSHTVLGDTKVTSMWVLLPERRPPGRFRLIASSAGEPGADHAVRPTRFFEAMRGRTFGWQIVGPEPDTTYEAHWVME